MVINADRSKDKFLFFYESLIDVFQVTPQSWAFSVKHGKALLYQYLNQPIYQYPEQALRAAKLHALINFCERSCQLDWLTLYPSERVLTQSEKVIAQFGNTTDLLAIDPYQDKQVRVDFLQEISLNRRASSFTRLLGLDGEVFDGIVTAQLIQFDEDTAVLLENFKLVQPLNNG